MSANNATIVQIRRGNTAQTAAYTGALAELIVDTDQNTIVVQDGTTQGGHYLISKDQFNANVSYLLGIDGVQNTAIQVANTTANNASANTVALQGGLNTANANIAYILAVDIGQNTAITNTTTFANGAYNTANSAQANTIALQGGLNTANANIAYILGVDIAQNTAIASANSMAFGAAATANTKLPLTGGTLTGDLVVNANLTVTGTTFYANTQMVDVANNNLILNASVSSTTTPTQNVYVTIDRGNQANSQIIWNESQKNWQLNNGTITDYVATYANTISLQGGLNTANANIAYILGVDSAQNTAILSASANTIALQGGLNTANANIAYILGVDIGQNTAITNTTTFANSAYNQANLAYIVANNAYNLANTESSYAFANAAFNTANSAQANTVALQGAMATANANIAYILAVDIGQNTSISNLTTFANAAYNTANSAQANTVALQGGLNTANANIAYILAVDIGQNTSITNTTTFANAAYNTANSAQANTIALQGGLNTANANIAYILGVDLVQNTNITNTTTFANAAYNKANTSLQLSGTTQTVSSNVTIQGNLSVTGNVSFTGNATSYVITGNTGQFFGYSANGFNAFYSGIPVGYLIEPQIVNQITSNYNGYAGGVNMQNINSGANASSDLFISADNGTVNDGFLDLGLGSSNYNYPGYNLIGKNDGYLFVTGNTTTGGGNMIVGTGGNNDIIFPVGGINTQNEVMRVSFTGNNVTIKTNVSSTSTTTGALKVIGGVGVTGNLYATGVYDNGVELFSYSNAAYNTANNASANTIALQGGLNTANANIAYILGVDLAQNTAIQVANNTANIANARAYSTVLKTGDTMTGSLQITGAASNVIVQQSSVAGDIANTFAHAYTMGLFTANTDQSTQVGIQNFANTANSSTDLALYNNLGTDTNNFIDMGITSTSYNVALNGFTAAQPGDAYLYSNGVNLLIGTQTVGKNLKIFVGGYNSSNVAATFNAPNTASSSNTTGTLSVTGGVGVTGNVYSDRIYTNGLYYAANGNPISTGGGSSITLSDSVTSNSSANAATSNAVYIAVSTALAFSIALG